MESAEQVRRMKQVAMEERSVFPAVVTSAIGILGMVAIAAGPWMVLTADATWDQPAVQAATMSPAVAESKRVFGERRERLATREGAQQPGITLAVSFKGPVATY